MPRCTIPRQRPRRRPRSSTSGQPDRPRRGSKSQTARPPRPRPMAPAATRTSAGRISTTSSTAWSERGWCPPGRMNAPDGHHPGAPDGRRLHRGPVLRRSGRCITSVINGAMTSWVLRDTRLPAHGACADPKAIANNHPGPDRQELLHAGSPTSSYGRKIGAADRSQPTPACRHGDGTPPRGWVNMICKNARADTAQTSHPGHVSPQRPLYGSAVMPPQPRRPGNRSPATQNDMFSIRPRTASCNRSAPNVQSVRQF